MIHVNTASLTELYHYGTVCQKKVVSSSTVKNFKVRLDRFWAHEEIYNYKTIKPIYHAPEVEVIMTLN